MLKIAVTGNMGSGKSLVCKVFESLGTPIFYADQEAKKIYLQNEIKAILQKKFGPDVYLSNGCLNTQSLASIIFKDEKALHFINSLIHPRVYEQFNLWVSQQKNATHCIMESALVFETGSFKHFDKTILVYAPEEILVERIMKRDNSTPEQAKERLSKQMPQSKKMKLADFLIHNDNTNLIIPNILELHHLFSTYH
jgi:dephospho-CoA kinase